MKRFHQPRHRMATVLLLSLTVASIAAGFLYFSRSHATFAAAPTQHYFYTFTVGHMYVFDMDHGQQLVKTVSLPIQDPRGVVANPNTGMLYVSHGGTGGVNGPGSLLKYNLLTNSVVWNINFASGVDSMGITPDGQTIYLSDGDQNTDGKWYVLDANTGAIKTTVITASGAHNAQVSLDGKHVYLGSVKSNYLFDVDTTTNKAVQTIGPLQGPVRPFTFNSTQTVAYINETALIGFQVASITTGKVLYTVQPQGFNTVGSYTAFSHGVSMSPDERELYLMDAPNDYVHVYDITGVPASPPKQVADIKLSPITPMQAECQYDCQTEGWVQHSLDGRFVYVADSGDVIDTATRRIVATLSPLTNSRISLEVDWSNGTTVAASTRTSIGRGTGGTTTAGNGQAFKGPVAKTWYFAEGHIGKGFREYLTVDNPDPNTACSVTMQYLYTPNRASSTMTKAVSITVAPGSRATESVNNDLGFDSSGGTTADVATTITVNPAPSACSGVVAERPVYFTNYHGLSSGTDVVGATQLAKTFYFADIPASSGIDSYLTVLNPNAQSATVTATYYANGRTVQTQQLTVPANARGTLSVNAAVSQAHVAAVVTASQAVLVERPTYFSTMGAADIVGAQNLANDWLFAEGYTGPGFQETLTIANVDPANKPAAVTVTLKSRTGKTQAFPLTVAAQSQTIWSVNANNTFAGSSPEVSAEVQSSGANVVVQREMGFQYHHAVGNTTMLVPGVTDVLGQVGPASKSAYTFAEGYANTGYSEWLTIQNPTATAETIQLSIVNGNTTVYDTQLQVGANSRFTLDIASTVQAHLAIPGNTPSFEVAMTVQTLNNGGRFVAERSMYWNTSGSGFPTIGGSDVVGYTG